MNEVDVKNGIDDHGVSSPNTSAGIIYLYLFLIYIICINK